MFAERHHFDHLLIYEDFVHRPAQTVAALQAKRIPAELHHYQFRRSAEAIVAYNAQHSAWCNQYYPGRWTFGNLRAGGLERARAPKPVLPDTAAHVRQLCPSVCAFFDTRSALNT